MASTAMDGNDHEAKLRQLMPPPAPRPLPLTQIHLAGDRGVPKSVLVEEDYTEGIAAIIERDYFPDIPKLRNQLEWAQAVKSGDPAMIRQAQVNIARRRAGLATPKVQAGATHAATPGGWGHTPATAILRTPAMTPLPGAPLNPLLAAHATPAASSLAAVTPSLHAATPSLHANQTQPATQQVEELRAPPMNLDTFLATHTSEDNASFAKIHAKDIQKKRQKVVHHLEDKNRPLLLGGPGSNPQEEYGTSGQQPATLVPTRHNPHNALYYPPDQKPLSAKEAEQQALRQPKQINIRATRLKPAIAADAPPQQPPQQQQQAVPGEQQVKQWGPSKIGDRDYNRLGTPAFTPGMMGESPLMTWGDIASTPLRLELEDTGVVLDKSALHGPSFEVPRMPQREQLGHDLAAAKSVRELRKRQQETREAAAIAAILPPGASAALASVGRAKPGTNARPWSSATPTPGRTGLAGSSTPSITPKRDAGMAGLSVAAQRLAKNLKLQQQRAPIPAGGGDLDRMLRTSYTVGSGKPATPATTARVGSNKGINTPSLAISGQGAAISQPSKHTHVQVAAAGQSITDNLLHI